MVELQQSGRTGAFKKNIVLLVRADYTCLCSLGQ